MSKVHVYACVCLPGVDNLVQQHQSLDTGVKVDDVNDLVQCRHLLQQEVLLHCKQHTHIHKLCSE